MTGKKVIIGFLGFAVLTAFMLWGPPKIFQRTSTPDFCNSCHVMNEQFEVWFLTGVHRNIQCVDCHLPNNNFVSYTFWKGIDGTLDFIYFYGHGRIFPEFIQASGHAKKTIQANCVRCHSGMVSRMSTEGRNCWDCHRRMNHKFMDFRYSLIK